MAYWDNPKESLKVGVSAWGSLTSHTLVMDVEHFLHYFFEECFFSHDALCLILPILWLLLIHPWCLVHHPLSLCPAVESHELCVVYIAGRDELGLHEAGPGQEGLEMAQLV